MGYKLDATKGEQIYRGMIVYSPENDSWSWRNPITNYRSATLPSIELVKQDIDREIPTQVVDTIDPGRDTLQRRISELERENQTLQNRSDEQEGVIDDLHIQIAHLKAELTDV